LMTPRPEIVWLDLDDPAEEIQRQITDTSHTCFPVAQSSLDNVLGIVRAKELLTSSLTSHSFDLKALVQPPLFVPKGTAVSNLVELFKEFRTGMALVLNEYGGIEGLVTLNDVLEAIVGDVPSASELTGPQVVPREDGSWLLDGMLPLDEFKEIFRIEKLPGEERDRYQTLGGFVMSQINQIPTAGWHFDWDGLRFEVIDMDGRRVDKVLIMPIESPEAFTTDARKENAGHD
jgi:putative hemolysin